MKLLFFLTRFPAFGGIETVTDIVGSTLVDSGQYVVDVVSILKGDRDMELVSKSNIFYFPEPCKWKSRKNREFILEVLSKGNYDAIIYQDSYSGVDRFLFPIVEKFNLPIYVFEHNSPLWFTNFTKQKHNKLFSCGFCKGIILFRRWIINYGSKKYLLNHCSKYILLSSAFINDLNKIICIDKYKEKILSINNPIVYAPICKEKRENKENIILTVCQLNQIKRVDLMLSIFKKISTIFPNWSFIIVGDGIDRQRLENIVKDESIPSVKFMGYSDPTHFYEKAKIFWMTSAHEGWGMTLVEAMQKGCVPVVMNTFSSLTDIVDDNFNGCIVHKDDDYGFIERTIQLISDDDYFNTLSNNAIHSVSKFDVGNIILKWQELLAN